MLQSPKAGYLPSKQRADNTKKVVEEWNTIDCLDPVLQGKDVETYTSAMMNARVQITKQRPIHVNQPDHV